MAAQLTLPQVASPPRDLDRHYRMTYDEFLAVLDDSVHAEWVDGEVTVFMPAAFRHQDLSSFLTALLRFFCESHNLGKILAAPFEMRTRPDGPAREPDLLFVARDHLDRLTPQRLTGPADLVIEIISESSVYRDRVDKFDEYQADGVPEYWLLDPRPGRKLFTLYQRNAQGLYEAVAPDDEGRYHSSVLAGFWLRESWLSQDPLPLLISVLHEIAPGSL